MRRPLPLESENKPVLDGGRPSRALGPPPRRKSQVSHWLFALIFLALIPVVAWRSWQQPPLAAKTRSGRAAVPSALSRPPATAPTAPAAPAPAQAEGPAEAPEPREAPVEARPVEAPRDSRSESPLAVTPGSPVVVPMPLPVESRVVAPVPLPLAGPSSAPPREAGEAAGEIGEKAVELVFLKDGTTVFLRQPARREGESFVLTTASGLDLKVGRDYVDFPRTYKTFLRPAALAARLEPPQLQHQPRPVLRVPVVDSARLAGSVRVAVLIDARGEVEQARIVREDLPAAESAAEPLRQAALAAARQATFLPARLERQPQRTWVTLEYRFGTPAGTTR